MRRRVYIGYDPRDHLAFEVCRRSLLAQASVEVEVVALKDWELRRRKVYWRGYDVAPDGQMFDQRDGKPFSTQFSFTRFAVPLLEDYGEDWVLFCDADMLWRADVADLFALADEAMAVMVVKHRQVAAEALKMDGVLQTANRHGRKNWSSLMLIRPARCRDMTRYALNNATGDFLHALCWVRENEIGALPAEWNHLVGYDDPANAVRVAHFTLGTPDLTPVDGPLAAEWWRWAAVDR